MLQFYRQHFIMGYLAALLIGISLGLIGGGGSILTVPVLVYFFGISPITATSYSLFIVGSTSVVGSLSSLRQGWIDFKTVILFGLPSVIIVFFIRHDIIGLLPSSFDIGKYTLNLSDTTMVLFALLMLFSAVSMIRRRQNKNQKQHSTTKPGRLLLYGIGVGLVTGFLGAGGGFLLIPALTLGIHLPMKTAVGTSLVIIAVNSITGFLADAGNFDIQWKLLIIVTLIAITGIIAGGYFAKKIQHDNLKTAFGWFVLIVGIAVIIQETLFITHLF